MPKLLYLTKNHNVDGIYIKSTFLWRVLDSVVGFHHETEPVGPRNRSLYPVLHADPSQHTRP